VLDTCPAGAQHLRTMTATHRTWPIVASTFFGFVLLSVVVTLLTFNSIEHLRVSVLNLVDAHQSRRDHIEALRSQIYVSSILIRDLLLDRMDTRMAAHRAKLQENRTVALEHIRELERLSSPHSRATVQSLSAEVHGYWESIDAFIRDTSLEKDVDLYAYVRTQLLPRRQAVIALAEELADISAAEARAGRQDLDRSINDFQQEVLFLRGIATAVVAIVALFTTIRVFRLERASAAERRKVERAEAEMRNLSQQLVNSQEQERRSLSRELHDDVGQIMTALRFGLSDLEEHCPAPTQAFSQTLQNCRAMLERAIETIRGLAMGLRPSMLDDLGLGAAMEWQAREFSRRFDIPVTVNVDPQLAHCPEPRRTALYRIAQEALTNCARHARASSVAIDLTRSGDTVRLTIKDDGVGLSAAGGGTQGFGVIGMQERVRELGGMLTMQSAGGGGTVVNVEIPDSGDGVSAKNNGSSC
jgi:signal transduction histidine kinase